MRRSFWARKPMKVPKRFVFKTTDGRKIVFKSKGIHNKEVRRTNE